MSNLIVRESLSEIRIHQKGHGCFAVVPLGHYPWFTDKARANAALIAAAPEMLEALKAALPHIECKSAEQSGIIDFVGNVVAKAEGGEDE